MEAKPYSPAGSQAAVSWLEPSRFFALTVHWGTRAPLGSFTTPEIAPRPACACDATDPKVSTTAQVSAATASALPRVKGLRFIPRSSSARTRDSRSLASAIAGALAHRARRVDME